MSVATAPNDIDYKNGITTSNLTKVYRNFRAVDSLTIDVNPGDIFGFLGPNGAGKTTTIRMLCGLLSPTTGSAKVAGFDIAKDSLRIKSMIGLLPESSGFYNWMNAEEYLLYFAALYKIEPQVARKKANNLLEKVGLSSKSFAPIGYYSRGMKQRLGLARALINNPKIIFLDEPTLGLDPKGQQDIQKILLELNHEKEVTVFLSSHALSEVSALCNRIAIVNHGRLVAQGTIDELMRLATRGSSGRVLQIRILNSQSAQKDLSDVLLPIQLEANTSTDNKLINVTISEKNSSESANDIIDKFEKAGLQIYEVRRLDMSLEDVFFKLTEIKQQNKKNKKQNDESQEQYSRPYSQTTTGLGQKEHQQN
jgi:ABC-2 type transport system ATP-binding protein